MAARKGDRQPFSEILELRVFKFLVDDPGTQISIISIMVDALILIVRRWRSKISSLVCLYLFPDNSRTLPL